MELLKFIMDKDIHLGNRRFFNMLTIAFVISLLATPIILSFQHTENTELLSSDSVIKELADIHDHQLDEIATTATQNTYISFLTPSFYSNISTDIFQNETRASIHQLISDNQGITFGAITRELKLVNGAAQYHLRVLEREGYVKSNRVGKYTRYYLTGHKTSDITEIQENIIKEIRENEGISQSQIASCLDISRQVVNYNIKKLVDSGLIKEIHVDNRCIYFIL